MQELNNNMVTAKRQKILQGPLIPWLDEVSEGKCEDLLHFSAKCCTHLTSHTGHSTEVSGITWSE